MHLAGELTTSPVYDPGVPTFDIVSQLDLQAVIAACKAADVGVPLQYVNFRD